MERRGKRRFHGVPVVETVFRVATESRVPGWGERQPVQSRRFQRTPWAVTVELNRHIPS